MQTVGVLHQPGGLGGAPSGWWPHLLRVRASSACPVTAGRGGVSYPSVYRRRRHERRRRRSSGQRWPNGDDGGASRSVRTRAMLIASPCRWAAAWENPASAGSLSREPELPLYIVLGAAWCVPARYPVAPRNWSMGFVFMCATHVRHDARVTGYANLGQPSRRWVAAGRRRMEWLAPPRVKHTNGSRLTHHS
jgi:hypothetical protein